MRFLLRFFGIILFFSSLEVNAIERDSLYFEDPIIYRHIFDINKNIDSLDSDPGDGECSDDAGFCSFAAVFQELLALDAAGEITGPVLIRVRVRTIDWNPEFWDEMDAADPELFAGATRRNFGFVFENISLTLRGYPDVDGFRPTINLPERTCWLNLKYSYLWLDQLNLTIRQNRSLEYVGSSAHFDLISASPAVTITDVHATRESGSGFFRFLKLSPNLEEYPWGAMGFLDVKNSTFDGFGYSVGASGNIIDDFSDFLSDSYEPHLTRGGTFFVRQSQAYFNQVSFKNSIAGIGGAVWAHESFVNINQSQVNKNKAFSSKGGAGIFASRSSIQIVDSSFLDNQVECSFIDGETSYLQCFRGSKGGAVSLSENARTVIHQSVFENNRATNGAAISVEESDHVELSESYFFENFAQRIIAEEEEEESARLQGGLGGALYLNRVFLMSNQNTFEANRASNFGSAIYVSYCLLQMEQTDFLQNKDVSAVYIKNCQAQITQSRWQSNQETALFYSLDKDVYLPFLTDFSFEVSHSEFEDNHEAIEIKGDCQRTRVLNATDINYCLTKKAKLDHVEIHHNQNGGVKAFSFALQIHDSYFHHNGYSTETSFYPTSNALFYMGHLLEVNRSTFAYNRSHPDRRASAIHAKIGRIFNPNAPLRTDEEDLDNTVMLPLQDSQGNLLNHESYITNSTLSSNYGGPAILVKTREAGIHELFGPAHLNVRYSTITQNNATFDSSSSQLGVASGIFIGEPSRENELVEVTMEGTLVYGNNCFDDDGRITLLCDCASQKPIITYGNNLFAHSSDGKHCRIAPPAFGTAPADLALDFTPLNEIIDLDLNLNGHHLAPSHKLKSDSPAINDSIGVTPNNFCRHLITDQRGQVRTTASDSFCDIGAIEFRPFDTASPPQSR